jgi:hypothetical protein
MPVDRMVSLQPMVQGVISFHLRNKFQTRCWWLIPVILATQEEEIRKIEVLSRPEQTVHETPSPNNPITKKRDGGVVGGIGPSFKPQYYKNNKKRKTFQPGTGGSCL